MPKRDMRGFRPLRRDRRAWPGLSRRAFLRDALAAAGALALGAGGLPRAARAGRPRQRIRGAVNYGPLGDPDPNGIRLPQGFSSRVVAIANQAPTPGATDDWHIFPDGGAVFPTNDSGWVYVSNSEAGFGGVGALRFGANAAIQDAYAILTGTSGNCAGGPTPWGTWLSCEEYDGGHAWECDPFNPSQGVIRPPLGTFKHEGAAVDPFNGHVYLTEDQVDGRLYRFTPTTWPDLSSGLLEVAEAQGSDPFTARPLVWHALADPNPSNLGTPTRHQVPDSTVFKGGEGIFYENGFVYFTTKFDNRVWMIDTMAQPATVEILYDRATSPTPILSGVDNVFVTDVGDVFVAEDGGNMEIVALAHTGDVVPVLQVTGQSGSEITGPALWPESSNAYGDRLYFSSQRGGPSGQGITYEVIGPFRL